MKWAREVEWVDRGDICCPLSKSWHEDLYLFVFCCHAVSYSTIYNVTRTHIGTPWLNVMDGMEWWKAVQDCTSDSSKEWTSRWHWCWFALDFHVDSNVRRQRKRGPLSKMSRNVELSLRADKKKNQLEQWKHAAQYFSIIYKVLPPKCFVPVGLKLQYTG